MPTTHWRSGARTSPQRIILGLGLVALGCVLLHCGTGESPDESAESPDQTWESPDAWVERWKEMGERW